MDRAEAICHWQADLKTLVLPFGLSSLPPTSVVKAASSLEVFDAGSIAELISSSQCHSNVNVILHTHIPCDQFCTNSLQFCLQSTDFQCFMKPLIVDYPII